MPDNSTYGLPKLQLLIKLKKDIGTIKREDFTNGLRNYFNSD